MTDSELLRYSRQIMLPEIDFLGQQKLKNSRVLIIGLGGLGSPISLYLASSGIGHLVLSDFDQVELSNLQRQIIHQTASIGEDKVSSAQKSLSALNATIKISTINKKMTTLELTEQMNLADVVIDASDNFATRFLVNKISWQTETPLVSAAAIKFEGQISVFNLHQQSPCYQCLYKDIDSDEDLSCSGNDVIAPLLGILGSMQAMETIKILTSVGETLDGRLLIFDAKYTQWREVKLNKDPQCCLCAITHHEV